MISNHYIFNFIEGQVNLTTRPVFCASRLETIPSSFPACYVFELSRYDRGAINLTRTDRMKFVTWEAQIFSNLTVGAEDEAYSIMTDLDDAMAHLGFTQTYCEPIANIDPSIYRLVGRWTRLIGDGDSFPVTPYPEPTPTPSDDENEPETP